VIAFRRGSVPEIVTDGVSGFVVDTVEEAVRAVRRIATLDRVKVRAEFERRFTCERMAREYVEIYQALATAPAEAIRGLKDRNLPARADEFVLQANEPRRRPQRLPSPLLRKQSPRAVLVKDYRREGGPGSASHEV
jgi:hypothetical protein